MSIETVNNENKDDNNKINEKGQNNSASYKGKVNTITEGHTIKKVQQ